MSQPLKKRKNRTSKAIPSLEPDLKAVRTLATKMESTHQTTVALTKELAKRTKELRIGLATLRTTDESFQIYNSEHSKPTHPIGQLKKSRYEDISNFFGSSELWFSMSGVDVMTEKIRLIVACEYTLYIEAISRLLTPEEDIEIVAEASNAKEVERAIRQTKADLLLLDLDMGGLNAPKLLSLIQEEKPKLGVLLFGGERYDEKIVEAICRGRLDYLPNSANTEELTKSIRALVQREVWTQRKMMDKVISKFFFFIQRLPLYSEVIAD